MPFLRVIRDKRGYETTYLMHLYRDGARQRSKILYVFRTPGGVRVGRDPLEPEVLRQIESQYPEIQFNWTMVRESQQVIESSAEPRRRKPRREEEAPAVAALPVPIAVPAAAAPAAAPPRLAIPSAIDGATPDERIAFLAHWHPIIRERIPHRTSDPVRQEALNALADRLNPANWTDADEITAGLQQAAEALERLSLVFAKRRRRGRRKPKEPRSADSAPSES
ncbi:MAG TPA: hypothetical protein VKA59_21975 [Vicinamibacterales bacterium]|nr:hypothetical protein [Vicinamibacterales bacterium]